MDPTVAAELIGLLSRAEQLNTGPWFDELMKEAVKVIRSSGTNRTVTNSFGDKIVVTEDALTINSRTWSV